MRRLLKRLDKRLIDLSIPRKLTLMIAVFSVIICLMLALSYVGQEILSGVRAYVGGEGLWAKAQKDAFYCLRKYATTKDEQDYQDYLEYLRVPMGDHQARLELAKPDMDPQVVKEGFVEGRNNPEDVWIMIQIMRKFLWVPHIAKAVSIWTVGDGILEDFMRVGEQLHQEIASGNPSEQKVGELLSQVETINVELTRLEDEFSYTLGEGSRWLKRTLHRLMLVATLFFLACGLFIASRISRHLSHEIEALRVGAGRIAQGDYSQPLAVTSKDEIGELAGSFQQMADQRKQAEEALALRAQELKVAYEKLIEADKLKEMFFANVSHELRTPLTLILGPVRKRLQSAGLADEERRDLEVVERNARLLLKHVNDLLDISKLEAGRMHIVYSAVDLVRLARFVASHFEVLADERRIGYSIKTPDALPAQVDAEKVQRVLLNLLSNAFKFTPIGGKVAMTLQTQDGRAVFQVRDSGPGVPAHLREIIFQRFRQIDGGSNRKYGGTGLGLSIVKEFVDLHGGRVLVADGPDSGALFTIELPLQAPPGSIVRQAAGDLEDETAKQTADELRTVMIRGKPPEGAPIGITPLVLVVEDNPDMNAFVAETLAKDYRVITAFDGQEGLDQALRHRPDLILSDVMMPRMSGDQMVQELRSRPEMDGVPIVLLTAKADDRLRVKLLTEGAQDYLNKPFSAEELLARVQRLIAESKRAQEAILDREERLAQANVELQKRNQEMEQFVHTIAHDLKSPLVTVQGFAGYIKHDLEEGRSDRLKEFAQEMIVASRHMASMIDELLDLSRVGRVTKPPVRVQMNELIEEVVRPHAPYLAHKGVRLEIQESLPAVLVDRERMAQVFDNLLVNAINYGCTNSKPKIAIGCLQTKDEELFFVKDNGPGIPPKHHEKIFQLFQRLDTVQPGTGVGLAIAKRIVEHHGGRIWVESGSGQGATFWVSLPKADGGVLQAAGSIHERI